MTMLQGATRNQPKTGNSHASDSTGARDESISSLTALSRGAGLLSLAWLFPVLGWFLVAPCSIVIGLGAGVKALRKTRAKSVVPVLQSAPIIETPLIASEDA